MIPPGVIFDLAGTVVDFGSRSPILAFHHVFEKFGYEVTTEQINKYMGLSKDEHLRKLLSDIDPEEGDLRFDDMYDLFLPALKESVRERTEDGPLEGFSACLDLLSKYEVPFGFTTGYDGQVMQIILDNLAAHDIVPDAAVASDVHARPEPWIELECARRINAYPIKYVYKVGDTPVDIQAAHNAGMQAVGVCNSSALIDSDYDDFENMSHTQRLRRVHSVHNKLRDHADFLVNTLYELYALWDVEFRSRR